MSADFTSVRNHIEQAVFDAVQTLAARYPGLARNPEIPADVACVALNRLPTRYIRHAADLVFFRSEREHGENQRQVLEAVDNAFGFVQARTAMRARA